MRRSIMVALTGMAMLACAATPALAQQYPPDAPQCAAEQSAVQPGDTIQVVCTGWAPNSVVTATLFSEPRDLGQITADDQGAFSAPVTIPADTPPGNHTLRLSGVNANGQETHVDLAVRVAGSADTAPGRTGTAPGRGGDGARGSTGLPRTGGEALMLVGTAAGLLIIGSLCVVVAARQRKSSRLAA